MCVCVGGGWGGGGLHPPFPEIRSLCSYSITLTFHSIATPWVNYIFYFSKCCQNFELQIYLGRDLIWHLFFKFSIHIG